MPDEPECLGRCEVLRTMASCIQGGQDRGRRGRSGSGEDRETGQGGRGRPVSRRPKTARPCGPSGRGSGSVAVPASWLAVSSRATSISARGLPRVRSVRSWTVAGDTGAGACSRRSRPAASTVRSGSGNVGHRPWSRGRSPGGAVTSAPTRRPASRLRTKARIEAEPGSSHWASSTMMATGRCSAPRLRRANVPVAAENASWALHEWSSRALTAARGSGGSSSTSGRNGPSSSERAAKGSWLSHSIPSTRSTVRSSACRAA